jgi:hypothetical protein
MLVMRWSVAADKPVATDGILLAKFGSYDKF